MSIRLGALHKALVYGVTVTLAVTGLLWLVPHFFFASKGAWGAARHPVEPWALRLHGAAAMAFLVALGSMLPVHVRRAWQVRRNVRTGVTMLGAIVALIATGYALYYASSEELRPWISAMHWGIGLALIPFMILHDRFGKNAAAMQRYRSTKASRHRAPRDRNPKTRLSVETAQRRVS
jgi:hypothetical protein